MTVQKKRSRASASTSGKSRKSGEVLNSDSSRKNSSTRKNNDARKNNGARKNSGVRNSRQNRNVHKIARKKLLLVIGILFLVVITTVLLIRRLSPVDKGKLVGVNDDVLQYQTQVEKACQENGISEYSVLMLAIMQQESSGQGTDVLQCSESPFNTEYDQSPGAISDPAYSISVGVQTFAYCLEEAGCKSIKNTERVKIALQEYNFGNNYAGWVLENYGSYSVENATEFSLMMQQTLGWSSYGDPEYVEHVLRYYTR